jgi:hypothetical protein
MSAVEAALPQSPDMAHFQIRSHAVPARLEGVGPVVSIINKFAMCGSGHVDLRQVIGWRSLRAPFPENGPGVIYSACSGKFRLF